MSWQQHAATPPDPDPVLLIIQTNISTIAVLQLTSLVFHSPKAALHDSHIKLILLSLTGLVKPPLCLLIGNFRKPAEGQGPALTYIYFLVNTEKQNKKYKSTPKSILKMKVNIRFLYSTNVSYFHFQQRRSDDVFSVKPAKCSQHCHNHKCN